MQNLQLVGLQTTTLTEVTYQLSGMGGESWSATWKQNTIMFLWELIIKPNFESFFGYKTAGQGKHKPVIETWYLHYFFYNISSVHLAVKTLKWTWSHLSHHNYKQTWNWEVFFQINMEIRDLFFRYIKLENFLAVASQKPQL